MDEPIRLVVPDLGAEELAAVAEVFRTGYLTQGPSVAAFEAAFARRIGVTHAIATTSATTALHLALAASEIGPGDEVLVPDFTFPATANVVIQLGATPVLVDIDPATYAIDPESVQAQMTPRTRAIMPVHPFGLSADMDPILDIARAADVLVIEDAACAAGTTYRGRPSGSIGDLGCFSFHPRKAITTGEGGMVTTNGDAWAARARILRNHGGIREGGRFRFEAAGYNYRLSDILAAIGVVQLGKLDTFVAEKRRLADLYRDRLAGVAGVTLPEEPSWGGHVYQSFVVRLSADHERDTVIARLREAGIESTIGTYALHAEPYFRRTFGYAPGDLPRSYDAVRRSLTLPLYPGLGEAGVTRVASALRMALDQG